MFRGPDTNDVCNDLPPTQMVVWTQVSLANIPGAERATGSLAHSADMAREAGHHAVPGNEPHGDTRRGTCARMGPFQRYDNLALESWCLD